MTDHGTVTYNTKPLDEYPDRQAKPADNPIQHAKPSKLSKVLRPFHKSNDAPEKKEEVPPALKAQIQAMEERKKQKVEELQRQGKKPSNKDEPMIDFGAVVQGF